MNKRLANSTALALVLFAAVAVAEEEGPEGFGSFTGRQLPTVQPPVTQPAPSLTPPAGGGTTPPRTSRPPSTTPTNRPSFGGGGSTSGTGGGGAGGGLPPPTTTGGGGTTHPIDPAVGIVFQGRLAPIWQSVAGQANSNNCNQMFFAWSGPNGNPYPNFLGDTNPLWAGNPVPFAPGLSPMTGYGGDGDTNSIGSCNWNGSYCTTPIYQASGLQGGDRIGVSLAPRVYGSNVDQAAVANINIYPCLSYFPWRDGLGVEMALVATFPFVYNPGNGTIDGTSGIVFAYNCLQIGAHSETQFVLICPRLLQSQYPQAGEPSGYHHSFDPGDQGVPGGDGNPILYPQLGDGSAWITRCSDGQFNLGHNSTQHTYCWTMNSAQLQNALVAANQIAGKNFDTNPAAWYVRLVNLDAEAWGHGGGDPRFGFNFLGLSLYQL